MSDPSRPERPAQNEAVRANYRREVFIRYPVPRSEVSRYDAARNTGTPKSSNIFSKKQVRPLLSNGS